LNFNPECVLRILFNSMVYPFKSHDRHNYGADFKCIESYNSPATIATELFKPSTDSTSLLVSIKKTLFDLGGGFSLSDVTKKAGF